MMTPGPAPGGAGDAPSHDATSPDRDRATTGAFILPGYRLGFALIVSLFLLWAVANNFNDILIRQFQKALALDRAQAGFIQFVFYLGYFLVALPAGMLIRRRGYRAGILTGLGLYAAGALLFYPAAEVRVYGAFLVALFMIAAGTAFLETAANPYIIAFGDPARASQRLNLAQAFNGVGAVLAPTLGGLFIFSGVEHSPEALSGMSAIALAAYRASEARTVQLPYLLLAATVIVVAVAIRLVRLPAIAVPSPAAAAPGEARPAAGIVALLRTPTLAGAVIAQFFYVGAQVGIWSFFVDFVKDADPAISERQAAYLLSVSLILFTAGRFAGAAAMQRIAPVRLLTGFAAANVALCIVAVIAPPTLAIGALVATSLFMSIMFPTIFSLGVRDLGASASLGSSLIIMAIIGGAIFPAAMGIIGHLSGGLRIAMLAPAACFAVVAVYAANVDRRRPRAAR